MLSTETRRQIERRALEIQAAIEEKTGPYSAEIVPDASPLWHIATTFAAAESDALRFLSERGFGCYVPYFETYSIRRGRKIVHQRSLFPGHIFLFVWDVKRHWRRIMACPGVARILTVDERPVVVPFDAIYRMQAIEFSGIEALRPKPRRRRKKHLRAESDQDEIISISTKSYWREMVTLDDDGRNRLLHRALGVAA